SLLASPNPVPDGAPITFTGIITPVSGSPVNVRVHMEPSPGSFAPGECQPIEFCSVDSRTDIPTWIFPTLTSPIEITFLTSAAAEHTVRLYEDSDGVGCTGTCPATVYIQPATVTTHLAWSATGAVVHGGSIHVDVTATTDVGPVPGVAGDLHVNLPAGVEPPTGLPAGAQYASPPYNYIDDAVTVGDPVTYGFDTVVDAANGSTLTFTAYFFPNATNLAVSSSFAIKVGPDSTAPKTSSLKRSLSAGSLSAGAAPVRLTWTGSDNYSGIAAYELGKSTDGGGWATVSTSITTAAYTALLSPGHSYRFRVRAVDKSDNLGSWSYGSTFTLTSKSESCSAINYTVTWHLGSSTTAWGGKIKWASAAGAKASLTFTGSSIAWVSY